MEDIFKPWNRIILKISDITENSFVIDTEIPTENDSYPISYKLSMFAMSPAGENFHYESKTISYMPYTFVNPLASGIRYNVFLQAEFPKESFNQYDMQNMEVQTKFLPIDSLDFPIIVPNPNEPDGISYENKIEIHLPSYRNFIFNEFSDEEAVIEPKIATNANADGGSRKFCNRLIEDTSVAEMDNNGNVRGKKRGITRMKIWKYDNRDKFVPFYKEIEVIQDVTNIVAEKTDVVLKTGQTEALNITVLPEDANDKRLFFESDNPAAVSVNESTGVITAIKPTKENETVTIKCNSVDKPLIIAYIKVRVVNADVNIWNDIKEVKKYFNASDFNSLVGNVEYIYAKLKEKFPTVVPLPRITSRVSETTGFLTMKTVFEDLFENVSFLYNSIAGTEKHISIGEYAPNRDELNEAISMLNDAKALLEA